MANLMGMTSPGAILALFAIVLSVCFGPAADLIWACF